METCGFLDPSWRDDPVLYLRVSETVRRLLVYKALEDERESKAFLSQLERAPSAADIDAAGIDYSPLDSESVTGRLDKMNGNDWVRLFFMTREDPATSFEAAYIIRLWEERAGVHVHSERSLTGVIYYLARHDELNIVGEMLSRHGSTYAHKENLYVAARELLPPLETKRRTPRRRAHT